MENRKKLLTNRPQYTGVWLTWLLLLSLVLPATSLAQSILWKSVENGHTLYLMGSIHVLKASHYPLPAAMEQAYNASDVIVFEVDIAESEAPATQQLFLKKGMFQKNQTLRKNISAQTYKELRKHLATIQISPNLFSKMKPPLCAITLTMLEMQRLGFDPKYGLDQYFNDKALQDGKKTVALETIAYQINLFFDQSKKDQELFLKQTLTEMSLLEETMQKMDRAWVTGDAQTLNKVLSESFDEFPEFHERLLLQRNRNWIKTIKTLHRQNKSTLVVVGAAHLVGPESVVDLLEQQGYHFEQL